MNALLRKRIQHRRKVGKRETSGQIRAKKKFPRVPECHEYLLSALDFALKDSLDRDRISLLTRSLQGQTRNETFLRSAFSPGL